MDLAYADEGPGPVVVLLHGFPLEPGDVERADLRHRLDVPGDRARTCGATAIRPLRKAFTRWTRWPTTSIELLDTLEHHGRRSWWAGCRWEVTSRFRWWHAIRSESAP